MKGTRSSSFYLSRRRERKIRSTSPSSHPLSPWSKVLVMNWRTALLLFPCFQSIIIIDGKKGEGALLYTVHKAAFSTGGMTSFLSLDLLLLEGQGRKILPFHQDFHPWTGGWEELRKSISSSKPLFFTAVETFKKVQSNNNN